MPHAQWLARALRILIPAVIVLTVACGLGYAEAQQVLRSDANDPQVQLAEDAAAALDAGAQPAALVGAGSGAAALVGAGPIDVARSLAPFLVIFAGDGTVLAANAQLDGKTPVPPAGVLATAAENGSDIVTWEPRSGVRIAAVAERWSGGVVLAGRSLRLVEQREDNALLLACAAWVAGLGALAAATALAWWLDLRRVSVAGGPTRA